MTIFFVRIKTSRLPAKVERRCSVK